jgi:hypothetical protein
MKDDLLLAARPAPSDEATSPHRRRRLRPGDILLPVALAYWAVGASQVHTAAIGEFGLPAILPIVFYVGVGLLVISIGLTLVQKQLSIFRLRAHLASLLLMLYGTAPLIYEEGRYAWLYKYIGITQYVNLHGSVNPNVDIFQDWPGFFAFMAWFDKVVGVQGPLAYAKWAQLGFEVLTCLMLSFAFRALPITDRERWLALFLYAGSIWIAQDYFSAQAFGVVLSVGIIGLVLTFFSRNADVRRVRWYHKSFRFVTEKIQRTRKDQRLSSDEDELTLLPVGPVSRRQDAAVLIVIALIYFVLVFEHELSPYIVLVQLVCLAVVGKIRHRWFMIVLAAIVVGYLLPHFTYVNRTYGLLASFGNFFGNAAPPSAATVAHAVISSGVHLEGRTSILLSLGIWGLSGIGAWRRWRSGRPTLVLMILAYSPILVLFLGAYGNEGILRVYLFSLPWAVCLAASALRPVAIDQSVFGLLRVTGVLVVVVTLFFPAFFGNDASYIMSKGTVDGTLAFYESASPGVIFAGDGNLPAYINGRYNEFPVFSLLGPGGIMAGGHSPSSQAVIDAISSNDPNPNRPVYVMITPSMQAYGTAYGFLVPNELAELSNKLNSSSSWVRIYNKPGLTVFELSGSL